MGARDEIVQKAREIAEPILVREGLEVVDMEMVQESGRFVLRVFIDKPGGVGLEDCQRGSEAIDQAIEVADVIPHAYVLEVSSPGLSRPLTKPEHFQKSLGKKVKVRTYGPVGEPPRKNFSGRLVAASPENIELEVEGAGRFVLPMKAVAKANLELEFPTPT